MGFCSSDQRVTEVRGRGKLRKPPAKSTAWAFHGTKDLTFFRELEVCMGGGAALRFDLRDSSHCALVLYAERSGYEELAYCDLWNAYALPSEPLVCFEQEGLEADRGTRTRDIELGRLAFHQSTSRSGALTGRLTRSIGRL